MKKILSITISLLLFQSVCFTMSLNELRKSHLHYINIERNHLIKLEQSHTLNDFAQRRAMDMSSWNYYSHFSIRGKSIMEEFKSIYGYDATISENILIINVELSDFPSTLSYRIVHIFKESTGHYQNIINPNVKYVGFGISPMLTRDGKRNRQYYVVEIFE